MKLEYIEHCAKVIHGGGVVAYPTEYCFGFGCDPLNIRAVKRIIDLKRRSWSKGMILVADGYSRFSRFLKPSWTEIEPIIKLTWPGPNTWLIPAREGVSPWLRGHHATLAVRVSAHRTVCQLVKHVGSAVLSTSANHKNQRPLRTAQAVAAQFSTNEVDYILPARVGGSTAPSTVRDLISGQVLRR